MRGGGQPQDGGTNVGGLLQRTLGIDGNLKTVAQKFLASGQFVATGPATFAKNTFIYLFNCEMGGSLGYVFALISVSAFNLRIDWRR